METRSLGVGTDSNNSIVNDPRLRRIVKQLHQRCRVSSLDQQADKKLLHETLIEVTGLIIEEGW